MQQHPIPQNITGYKFRLVGDMTLKQFLELAAGIVTAWIIFNSKVVFLIKWTLGPILAFFGFALAFLPIEDRPLDQWIINFVKAIYAPTQFLYRPAPKKLEIFETIKKPPTPQGLGVVGRDQPQLQEYLESLPQSSTSAFDQAEARYLEHISNLFAALGNKVLPLAQTRPEPAKPLAKTGIKGVRVRTLSHPQMCLLPRAVVFTAPEDKKEAAMPLVQTAQKTRKTQINQKVSKPVAQTVKPARVKVAPTKPKEPTAGPVFATDIVLPQKPDRPNLIAGITLNKAGKIIPGVILEIRDNQGFPVRALKSNKLGQFFIATPLPDGIYEVRAEHEGYKFAIIKLEAKNEIIPPLKIQAAA